MLYYLFFFDKDNNIVTQQRPVNLNLASLSYPPMAIASILHRISGLVLFLLLPIMLCFLHSSLESPSAFNALQTTLAQPFYKVILWIFSSALLYHLFAGIRHLIMDLGFGESLNSAKRSALFVIILSILTVICLGVWIW